MTKQYNIQYQKAQKSYWTGRTSNPAIENQYWHQEIILSNLQELDNTSVNIALIGYMCDEGVRRNLGRIGADKAPIAFREKLAKLPVHFNKNTVADVGDIICIDKDMESCQLALANSIEQLISKKIFPIAIGGGHDISYGHFKGVYNAVKNSPKNKIGIVNFDAHFDLRPVEKQTNSGTPFNQILNEFENVSYFAIGIQQQANTKELFEIAKNKDVNFISNDECETSKEELDTSKSKLQSFINNCDYLYITIDLDGFSSAYAPGVSAPSPVGFTPQFVFKILSFLFDSKKVISCDIAELNPALDNDNLTANLAAKLADFIVMKLEKK